MINDRTVPLTAPPGAYPTLTVHGEEYGADEGTYTISGGVNLYGEVTLTPGGRQVLTWNQDQISRPFGPTVGNCSRPEGNIIQSQCATAQCTIGANSVELLYFPPPSTSRDLCANTSPGFNSYSVPIFSNLHASTIINSTTYWYDKAYVRYDTVSAYKWCQLDNQLGQTSVTVGGTYSRRLVEISSSDLSSICDWKFNPTRPYGLVIGATAKPFNFEDLVGDIPASAYQCMPRCQSGCMDIITSFYIPGLAVPPQVRAQDPEWASCVPQFDGVPDPPIALASVPNFLTSSEPSGSRPSDPPTPGQTLTTGASPTAIPITQPPITTRFTSTILPPTSRPIPNDPGAPADPNPVDPNNPGSSIPSPNDPPPNDPPPNDPPPNDPPPNDPPPNDPPPNDPPPNDPNSNGIPSTNNNPATNTPSIPQTPSDWPQPITNPPAGPTPIATIGNSIVNTNPSQPGTIVISDPNTPGGAQTLTAGSDPIVISGTTISLNPTSGAIIVSGDSIVQPIGIFNGKPVFTDPGQPGVIIVGDPESGQPLQTLSVNAPTVTIDGETFTLSPTAIVQSSVTFAGMSIVVLADGTIVINNTHTIRPGDPEIFINGHKVVVDSNGVIWVDGQRVQMSPTSDDQSDSTTTPRNMPTAPSLTDPNEPETNSGPSSTTEEAPQNSSIAPKEAMLPRLWTLLGLVTLTVLVV
ncbi:hypothetical protein SLS60_009186 [Paraconiothyrium brasiliense]|uniref:Uncharacterized protein n=1 Tax=Paraconiothyrium brasiliense TaxID=300254 RepID=A0ABR3QWZ4_9PLEO